MSSETPSPADSPQPGDDCSLPVGLQVRNIVCFTGFWSLYYLSAPVLYIGLTHANLLKALGNSDTINNLPSAMYRWLSIVPVVVAWTLPRPRHLKPLALTSVSVMAAATAAVAVTLWSGASATVTTCAVIAHGAVFGAANGVLITTLWDFVRRGVATSRRGPALGLAYGIGPLFACMGALLQDALFQGRLLNGFTFGLRFPQNYTAMFAGAAPLMLGAAVLISLFRIPQVPEPPRDDREASADPLADLLREIRAGLRQFVQNRAVLMGVVLYVLVACGGDAILANVSLHAHDVLGETTETVGQQNFLRFGFKAVAGALLGLLLARTSPRATLLATTGLLLLGMCWALTSSGWWFLLTFGLLGAGELYGAHFPNYITTASRKSFVRINLAYANVLSTLIGFASFGFGIIADAFGRIASFYAAAGMLVLALLLTVLTLPANPTPGELVD